MACAIYTDSPSFGSTSIFNYSLSDLNDGGYLSQFRSVSLRITHVLPVSERLKVSPSDRGNVPTLHCEKVFLLFDGQAGHFLVRSHHILFLYHTVDAVPLKPLKLFITSLPTTTFINLEKPSRRFIPLLLLLPAFCHLDKINLFNVQFSINKRWI